MRHALVNYTPVDILYLFLLFCIFCRDLGCNEIVEFPRIQNERPAYYHLKANNLTYADRDVFAGVPNVRIL